MGTVSVFYSQFESFILKNYIAGMEISFIWQECKVMSKYLIFVFSLLGAKAPQEPPSSDGLYVCMYICYSMYVHHMYTFFYTICKPLSPPLSNKNPLHSSIDILCL